MRSIRLFLSITLFGVCLLFLPVAGHLDIQSEQARQLSQLKATYLELYPFSNNQYVGSQTFSELCHEPHAALKTSCQRYASLETHKLLSLLPLMLLPVFPLAVIAGWLISKAHSLRFTLAFSTVHKGLLALTWAMLVAEILITAYGLGLRGTSLPPLYMWLATGAGLALITVQALASWIIHRPRLPLISGNDVSEEDEPGLWEMLRAVAEKTNSRVPERVVIGETPGFFIDEFRYRDGRKTRTGRMLYASAKTLENLDGNELRALVHRELRQFDRSRLEAVTDARRHYESVSLRFTSWRHCAARYAEALLLFPFSVLTYICWLSLRSRYRAFKWRHEFILDKSSCRHSSWEHLATALLKIHCLEQRGTVDYDKLDRASVENLRLCRQYHHFPRHIAFGTRLKRLGIQPFLVMEWLTPPPVLR